MAKYLTAALVAFGLLFFPLYRSAAETALPDTSDTQSDASPAADGSTVADTASDVIAPSKDGSTASDTSTVGALHHFAIAPIGDQVAGVPFSVTITAYNADGTQADFSGTVQLASTKTGLTPATVSLYKGSLSFQLTLDAAAVDTQLTVSYQDIDGVKGGQSNTFSVSVPAPQPASIQVELLGDTVVFPNEAVPIRATVLSEQGQPLANVALVVVDDTGQVVLSTPEAPITDGSGTVTIVFNAPPSGGQRDFQVRAVDTSVTGPFTFFVAAAYKLDKAPHPNESVPAAHFSDLGQFQVQVLRVLDGAPKQGVTVTYSVVAGDAKIYLDEQNPELVTTLAVVSDLNGMAKVKLKTGAPGVLRLRATIDAATDGFVEWTIQVVGDLQISIVSGNGQAAVVGTTLPSVLKVLVIGADTLQPIAAVPVTFTVLGTPAPAGLMPDNDAVPESEIIDSDGAGHAWVTLNLGTKSGLFTVRASLVDGTFVDFNVAALPGPIDENHVLVTLVPSSLVVDQGYTQLSVALGDAYGNPIDAPPNLSISPVDAVGTIASLQRVSPGKFQALFLCAQVFAPVRFDVLVGSSVVGSTALSCTGVPQPDAVTPDADASSDPDLDATTGQPDADLAGPDSADLGGTDTAAPLDVLVEDDLIDLAGPAEVSTDTGDLLPDLAVDTSSPVDLDVIASVDNSSVDLAVPGPDLLPSDTPGASDDAGKSDSPVGQVVQTSYSGGGGCQLAVPAGPPFVLLIVGVLLVALVLRQRNRACR